MLMRPKTWFFKRQTSSLVLKQFQLHTTVWSALVSLIRRWIHIALFSYVFLYIDKHMNKFVFLHKFSYFSSSGGNGKSSRRQLNQICYLLHLIYSVLQGSLHSQYLHFISGGIFCLNIVRGHLFAFHFI